MIAWLVAIITFILALFILWRSRSAAFRARCEAPKFKFLENLGINQRNKTNEETKHIPKEDSDEPFHS